MRTPGANALAYPSSVPQTNRAALWSEQADRMLREPLDQNELRVLAAIAFRVGIDATTQAATWKAEVGGDDVLLTPAEVAKETGAKLHSVREAIRRGILKVWRPHPKAVRNLRVPRKVAKDWAGRN